ncbi:mechanosensitive ion channel family protein [Erythrobacteraceae bacterium E2-1 Yellow Sea]|nr:mechanosensitive ion channel family protein [Erythrobacteraceae bacterium E2-1 Yellow Sea]
MFEIIDRQIGQMWYAFTESLPSLFLAVILLVITGLIASFASNIADRIVGKTSLRPSLKNLIETLIKLVVWLTGLFIAAIMIFPDVTFGGMIAGLGIGAVAIGFAFQDIFENFLAGVLIMLREKMRIGDIIQCEGIDGKVEHITLRETHIRATSGELTVVPNSLLFKNPVEILTDVEQRCHTSTVGVSYDTDLDKAADVIRKAVELVDQVDTSKGIDVFVSEFNSSSVDFLVRWWAGSSPGDGHKSRDQVLRSIKRALDNAGIEIPFPYITHTFKNAVPLAKD